MNHEKKKWHPGIKTEEKGKTLKPKDMIMQIDEESAIENMKIITRN